MKSIALAICLFVGVAPATQAQQLDLSPYKGKVVLLDFWASWCAPCKLSFPWMNQLQQAYGANGIIVVAVNVDHDRSAAEAFLRDTPAQFPIVFNAKGKIASEYPVRGMPTSFVIGRDGKIKFTHSGFEQDHENEYLSHILQAARE